MANEKEMNPLSGDTAETNGVYRDAYGHEVQLKAGEQFPMDPQYGKVEYELVEFAKEFDEIPDGGIRSDQRAAESANVPVSAVNQEDQEAIQSRQLQHRRHGGNR